MRTKLLPTCAAKPIPPEFLEMFTRYGWQKVERMFGKATVASWSKLIGTKRMADCRKRYLRERGK